MLGRHSDAVILTNPEDREEWNAAVPSREPAAAGTPVHQIYVGPNIAEAPITADRRQSLRAAYGIPADAFLVGFFGFVNLTKGLDTLFEAARILRDQDIPIHVLIIGGSLGASDPYNAVYQEHLQRTIYRLRLDAEDVLLSTGYLSPADASHALATCDAMGLPFADGVSLRRASMLAALDHGLPVVTTFPKRPSPEIQESNAMLLVPPDDPAALSQALRRLYTDRELADTLGAAARQFARRFSWPLIAEHTLAVYTEACRRK